MFFHNSAFLIRRLDSARYQVRVCKLIEGCDKYVQRRTYQTELIKNNWGSFSHLIQ